METSELGLGLGFTALGGGLLWVLWRCWTGRWRRWAGEIMLDTVIRCFAPPVALIFFGVGLSQLIPDPVGAVLGAPFFLSGLLLLPIGFAAMFLPRRWWGPRWYRRLTDEELRHKPGVGDGLAAQVFANSRPNAVNVPGHSTAVSALVGLRTGTSDHFADEAPGVVTQAWKAVARFSDRRAGLAEREAGS